MLQFDQPLDLSRAKIGRLVGGQLNGKVIIRSDWKEPGPEDDLLIVTPRRPTHRADDLHAAARSTSAGVRISAAARTWSSSCWPARRSRARRRRPERRRHRIVRTRATSSGCTSIWARRIGRAGRAESRGSVPVEINCRGPFRFDVVGRVATFHDRVDVLKANPSGPSDQITCDLLSLYFAERSKEKPDRQDGRRRLARPGGAADRSPGNPVVVIAPSQKEHGGVVTARGPAARVRSASQVHHAGRRPRGLLAAGPNEIHARSLYYQRADPGRLGRVAAQGPGWLRGQSDDRPDQQLEARWKDKLLVEPDNQQQRITLTGGAELNFPGVGQLQAREIFFWLAEKRRRR